MYTKSNDEQINVDHVLSTLKEHLVPLVPLVPCTVKNIGDRSVLYFGAGSKSYFDSTGSGVHFMNLALPCGYEYYITIWEETKYTIISLSHDDFEFEDDANTNRNIHAKYFSTEEEHFQRSLVSKRVDYPYELVQVLWELRDHLIKTKEEHVNQVS